MKKYMIGAMALLFGFQINAQSVKKVMFLGNSYTDVNNLPFMVSVVAKSAGDSLIYNSNTPGGYTLQGHSTNTASVNLIQQGGWDYMVLQEQSQLPSFPLTQVMSQSYPYAVTLCNSFYQYNTCGQPLYFMTWGRKYGDQSNCATWPPVCTYAGMDSLLALRYRMYADSTHGLVSPVGAVWNYLINLYPNLELYSSDQSHPSQAGSYAAACTFYSLIFQKDPTNIKDDQNLNSNDAMNIRDAAKIVAYDSLAKWNVGKWNPEASFSYTQKTDTVIFTNTSQNAVDYKWDFGDGDTALTANATHIYSSAGTYKVILESSKCNILDTTSQFVTILPSGVRDFKTPEFELYPNPTQSKIHIRFKHNLLPNEITIYNLQGKAIKNFYPHQNSGISLDISDLESGVYFIGISSEGVSYRYKVVKW